MKIYLLPFVLFFSCFQVLTAQNNNFWQETSEQIIPSRKSPKVLQQPKAERYFKLDMTRLKQVLKKAPMEYTNPAKGLVIAFPLDDGSIENFVISESPVMAPKLAAKYPNIKSYSGQGLDNPLHSIRFDYTPLGFHGSIHTPKGKVYIDPFTEGKGDFCVVYNTNNMSEVTPAFLPDLGCGVSAEHFAEYETEEKLTEQALTQLRAAQAPVNVKIYRLALACTGEYGRTKGGSLESVNASYVTAINRVNQVFELEVAVRMQLIENNDRLIFLDPSTDPYNEANLGTGLLGQNLPAFVGAGVPTNSYDVGHVFTNACTDVGGVASGQVCTDGKMRGVTCHYSQNIEAIAVDVMSHEIGHQFSCGHSWDNCPSSAEQRAGATAYEPGSGSTIMSYAGSCGSQNIVNNGDDYYNIGTLESFIGYSRVTVANCGIDVPNGNNEPEVTVPYEDGFYIPASTPFELTAIGSDIDGDAITYCWEQHDAGVTPSELGNPTGNAALFRSRRPTTNPTRAFPSIGAVLGNSFNNTEVLPTYDRDLSFYCTVRDNVANGGGTVWDDVNFKADGDSGPFVITFPSGLSDILSAGAYQEITWNPANTENAPVNCKTVDIMISYDNGANFADTLARGVLNDGSFFTTIPERTSNNARIKIKASDNVFYDLSNTRIEILEATEPNYIFGVNPEFQEVCAPATISLDVSIGSVLDYEDAVEISFIGDIPDFIRDIEIMNEDLIPGDKTNIVLELDDPGQNEMVTLTLQAVSENADTTFRTVQFEVLSNDFSSLSLDGPLDGTSGLVGLADFSWSSNSTAISFDFELATNPSFSAESIIDAATNLTENNYTLDQVLEPTTLYYWRIVPYGLCGAGEPSIPSAFHSASLSCIEIEAEDIPIQISSSFSGDLISKINVAQDGAITDINISNIQGSHSDFSDLSFSIVSPAGTRVDLVKNKCFALTGSFDITFDQQSPFSFACPPKNVFMPLENLDVLIGESTGGIWELIINDDNPQYGGVISTWALEFCSNVALSNPLLVRNRAFDISQNYEKVITNSTLRVEDDDNVDWELIYTLVSEPKFGQLLNDGVPVRTGDKFTQFDLNSQVITFKTEDVPNTSDNFFFTVQDDNGGWTGTHMFNINIDENVSTKDLISLNIAVHPNPVKELLYVKTNSLFSHTGTMEVYNLQGQLLLNQRITGIAQENIKTSNLNSGIYFLKIQDENNTSITKFIVER